MNIVHAYALYQRQFRYLLIAFHCSVMAIVPVTFCSLNTLSLVQFLRPIPRQLFFLIVNITLWATCFLPFYFSLFIIRIMIHILFCITRWKMYFVPLYLFMYPLSTYLHTSGQLLVLRKIVKWLFSCFLQPNSYIFHCYNWIPNLLSSPYFRVLFKSRIVLFCSDTNMWSEMQRLHAG